MIGIQTVLAPNPGPFTGPGTNTYVVESGGECAVIDPGPVDDRHLTAVVEAVGDRRPVAVLVTHGHSDHAPLARPLADRLGVPLAAHPLAQPDRALTDGDSVPVGTVGIAAVHTPGHSPDHLCFLVDRQLFTGDHIMGGSSVMVEDMAAYLASLRRLLDLPIDRLWPGHGPPSDEPRRVIDDYLAHRLEREHQVREAWEGGARTVAAVVAVVYREVDPSLHPLAAISVRAHLRKLAADGVVDFSDA